MKASLVTVTCAAELLERDRQTVVRALRGTKPDRVEGKRQLFKWKTVKGELVDAELVSELLEAEYRVTREHFLAVPGACGYDLAQIARAAADEMTATILVTEKLRTTLKASTPLPSAALRSTRSLPPAGRAPGST